jgi:hypothetical protein
MNSAERTLTLLSTLDRDPNDESVHEALRLLSIGSIDMDAADDKGRSLLHLAAAHGLLPIVDRLIAKGAQVNKVNSRGSTPLHSAIQQGHDEVARRLVQAGSDPLLPNQQGRPAVHAATDGLLNELIALAERPSGPPARSEVSVGQLHTARVSTRRVAAVPADGPPEAQHAAAPPPRAEAAPPSTVELLSGAAVKPVADPTPLQTASEQACGPKTSPKILPEMNSQTSAEQLRSHYRSQTSAEQLRPHYRSLVLAREESAKAAVELPELLGDEPEPSAPSDAASGAAECLRSEITQGLVERWIAVASRMPRTRSFAELASVAEQGVGIGSGDVGSGAVREEDRIQIEKDLHRSKCAAISWLPVTWELLRQLRRLLLCWCVLCPEQGYTQGMSHVALVLLQLTTSSALCAARGSADADAFTVFVLLNSRLPSGNR